MGAVAGATVVGIATYQCGLNAFQSFIDPKMESALWDFVAKPTGFTSLAFGLVLLTSCATGSYHLANRDKSGLLAILLLFAWLLLTIAVIQRMKIDHI